MRRAGIVIMVMAALGLSLAAPAFAQYPVLEPEIFCPHTARAGEAITVSGVNWLQNSTVVLTFNPVVGTPQTDDEGSFSTTVTIPADAEAGRHAITAVGRDQNGEAATATCPITVPAAVVPPGGEIAVTGMNISLGLVLLAVLIAAGLGFIVAGRRKKAEAEH